MFKLADNSADNKHFYIYLVGYVLSSFGTGFVYPLTSLYLNGPLQASTVQLSLYFIISAGAAILCNPIAGHFVDRGNPRGVLLYGLSAQTIGALLLSVAPNAWSALAIAIVIGSGTGTYFAAQTPYLNAIFGKNNLSAVFSAQYLLANLAAFFSGIAGGTLITIMGDIGYRVAFVINALSFVALAVVAIILPINAKASHEERGDKHTRGKRSAIHSAIEPFLSRAFLPIIFIQLFVVLFGYSQQESVLSLVYKNGAGMAVFWISAFLSVNGLAVVLLQTIGNYLVEKHGLSWGIQATSIVWVIATGIGVSAYYCPVKPVQISLLMLFGIAFAVGETFFSPSFQPLVVESSPTDSLGSYSAATSQTYSIATILGPSLGLMIFNYCGAAVYWIIMGVGMIALYLFARLIKMNLSKR